MKVLPVESAIPLGSAQTLYSEMICYVRVEDLAAGPFLVLRGEYDGDEEIYKKSEFALDSHAQIDEFCAILHQILKQAEAAS